MNIRHFLILAICVLLIPNSSSAQQVEYDASVTGSDIYFSKNVLIAGDSIRLYAQVRSVGSKDLNGYVRFYFGSTYIGDSQLVSMVAGGYPDQVYIDWVVPSTEFNIRAEIKGQSPTDQNPSNDVALTSLFSPKFDRDHDGITDDIDTDDDNDGLLDSEEAEIGTDPNDKDSDTDGVIDGDDDYPLDPSRSKIPAKIITSTPVMTHNTSSITTPEIPSLNNNPLPKSIKTSIAPTEDSTEPVSESAKVEEIIQPGGAVVLIEYEKFGWRSYIFEPVIRGFVSQNLEYRWEFGDGRDSDRRAPKHTYLSPGRYTIKLTLTDRALGKIYRSSDLDITISFFNFSNYQLWIVIGSMLAVLGLVLRVGKVIAIRKSSEE